MSSLHTTRRTFHIDVCGRRYANSQETIRTIQGDATCETPPAAADIGVILSRLLTDNAADLHSISEVHISFQSPSA